MCQIACNLEAPKPGLLARNRKVNNSQSYIIINHIFDVMFSSIGHRYKIALYADPVTRCSGNILLLIKLQIATTSAARQSGDIYLGVLWVEEPVPWGSAERRALDSRLLVDCGRTPASYKEGRSRYKIHHSAHL